MFVCAMPTSTPTGPQPVRLFRNFRPRKHVSFDCEIWEAARATTANPLLFTPVLIGPNWVPESFIDPGFRFNNPIELVIEEASSLYTPSTTEFSFLSLGAGNPGISNALVNEEVNWAAALHDIARDCEGTANQVARRSLPGYFRLNVSQGLQAIDLETSTAPGCIASHTQQYLRDVSIDQRLDEIVENLVKRHRQVTASSDNSYGTAIARSIDNGMTKFAMVLDKVVPAFPW
ncbi:hypothetical protein DL96DRAFT_263271 [Flagelloscypha sp. PMI_526]|nr:hypothetical protein DL96DRAFT_263271 [Flagelloscypha sp. PMI_526]